MIVLWISSLLACLFFQSWLAFAAFAVCSCYILVAAVPKGVLGRPKKDAPGQFIQLQYGLTHYEVFPSSKNTGSSSKNWMVLVHGFSSQYEIYRALATELAREGFDVLCYDLHGRGWSEASDALPMNCAMFVQQLHELLDKVCTEPGQSVSDLRISLLGYSMGGVIASAFSLAHPRLVSRLILVAPAGLAIRKPPSAKLLKLPLLRNLMMFIGPRVILNAVRQEWANIVHPDDPSYGPIFTQLTQDSFTHHKGYTRSLLKTMVEFEMDSMYYEYKKLGEHSRPVLLIWGDKDVVCPYEHAAVLTKLLPQSQLQVIPGGSHAIPLMRPHQVHGAIISFLRRTPQHAESTAADK